MTEGEFGPPLHSDKELSDAMEGRLRAMAAEVIEQHAERAGLANAPPNEVYERFGATIRVSASDDEIFRMSLVVNDNETGLDTRYELSEDGDREEFPRSEGTA